MTTDTENFGGAPHRDGNDTRTPETSGAATREGAVNSKERAPDMASLRTRRTWKDKLRCKLFPPQHCDLPHAPPTHKDVLVCRVTVELDMLDRLRVLIAGRIRVESRTVTANLIGDHKTKSIFVALPPTWLARD